MPSREQLAKAVEILRCLLSTTHPACKAHHDLVSALELIDEDLTRRLGGERPSQRALRENV